MSIIPRAHDERTRPVLREVIRIDEEKCDGCGLCVPNCPEGALRIVNGKAKLVNDVYCDGLGACIGHCPQGAITVEKREAERYDERRVIDNVARHGKDVLRDHLTHLEEHGEPELLVQGLRHMIERDLDIPEEFRNSPYLASALAGEPPTDGITCSVGGPPGEGICMESTPSKHEGAGAAGCGCPGSRVVDMRGSKEQQRQQFAESGTRRTSWLRHWPVQIHLVPPNAPYLDNADLLIAADCVPFAFAGFHEELLRGRIVLVGCPKLDDAAYYREKLTTIFSQNDVRSVTVAHMEVPCCFGMVSLVRAAVTASGKKIPVDDVMIGINGERMAPPDKMAL
jgi:ferredoxin